MGSCSRRRLFVLVLFFTIPVALSVGLHVGYEVTIKDAPTTASSHPLNLAVTRPTVRRTTTACPVTARRQERDNVTQARKLKHNYECTKEMHTIPRGGGGISPHLGIAWNYVLASSTAFIDWVAESSFRSWTVLLMVILADTAAMSLLKIASDNKDIFYLVCSLLVFAVNPLGFGLCLKQIDVSIAYATWSALGTATMSLLGIVFWGEEYDIKKTICLAMIVTGVVGLQVMDTGK